MEQWLSKTDLLRRGWSALAIDRLLPPPLSVDKMYRRSGHSSQLWPLDLVEQQEGSDFFLQQINKQRIKAERRLSAKQRQYLLSLVERCHIHVPRHSYKHIREATLNSVRDYRATHAPFRDDPMYAPPATIVRWQVNFIRHELTCYDDICKQLAHYVGERQAHKMLKNKVLALIAQTYPKFRDECARQKLPLNDK